MSYPRTPTTTTAAATTTPNATPNEPYDASPATPTVSATPSVSIPSKPHSSPTAASVTAIFDADGNVQFGTADATASSWAASEMVVTVPAMDNNFLPLTTSATTRPVWHQHGRTV